MSSLNTQLEVLSLIEAEIEFDITYNNYFIILPYHCIKRKN